MSKNNPIAANRVNAQNSSGPSSAASNANIAVALERRAGTAMRELTKA